MLKIDVENSEQLFKQINSITSTARERKQMLRRAGQMVIKSARERVKAQRDLNGNPFAPAKGSKRKGKLLRRLMRGKRGKSGLKVWAGPNSATVGWYSEKGLKGRIARMNQEGYTEKRRIKQGRNDE